MSTNTPCPTRAVKPWLRPLRARCCASALALGLAACGGGNNEAAIGGNLSGLASGTSLVLQDNGSDNLTVGANGTFSFANKLGASTSYAVTVLSQPAGQLCTVGGGSGSVNANGDDIDTVTVSCVSTSTVAGTVSGLATGTAVTLSNGQVLLPVAVNGAFGFPGPLAIGAAYNVTVATQPAGQTCTVLNGSGIVVANVVVNIAVICAP